MTLTPKSPRPRKGKMVRMWVYTAINQFTGEPYAMIERKRSKLFAHRDPQDSAIVSVLLPLPPTTRSTVRGKKC